MGSLCSKESSADDRPHAAHENNRQNGQTSPGTPTKPPPNVAQSVVPNTKAQLASTYDDVHAQALQNLNENYFRRSKSKLVRPVGVVGLSNMGNTCFMNSALQCLSATIPLTDYFLGYNYKGELNRTNPLGAKGKLATAYADLMSSMWSGKNLTLRPSKFKGRLQKFAPQFEGNEQHDVQEFLVLLLDGIHEDLNRIKKKPYIEDKDCDGNHDETDAMEAWKNYLCRDKSIIVDIFQGQMRNALSCLQCGHKNVRFEPFMYLSLPITSSCRTLQDCMDLYLSPEKLTGDNQWYCEKCKAHVDAMKKTDIWIMPPILIVHLKRFKFDEYGRLGSKNSAVIDFPVENWNLRKHVKSRGSDKSSYDLYGVSLHHGGMGGGHYTAMTQSRFEDEDWYDLNDSQTKRISTTLLKQHNVQSAAYLLFYNRSAQPADESSHHERTPLVRRQTVRRPDLWPHQQVTGREFRGFSRSRVIANPTGIEEEDGGGAGTVVDKLPVVQSEAFLEAE